MHGEHREVAFGLCDMQGRSQNVAGDGLAAVARHLAPVGEHPYPLARRLAFFGGFTPVGDAFVAALPDDVGLEVGQVATAG